VRVDGISRAAMSSSRNGSLAEGLVRDRDEPVDCTAV
jgi:hypothetical protein